MFSGLMVHAWVVATIVAIVAGVVGFFVVIRGASFVAHAIPQSGFAGAAGAGLLGVDTLVGLGVFALISALTIGWLGRRGRHDVVTALAVVMMLGLGALFLSWSQEYAPELYALLFGEILGVTTSEIVVTAVLAAVVDRRGRPPLPSAAAQLGVPEVGEARGVSGRRIELLFLVVVAMVTTTAVPVVGALLMFSLMVGPPAAARSFVRGPAAAIVLSVGIALATVWASVAGSVRDELADRLLRRRHRRRGLRRRPRLGGVADPTSGRAGPPPGRRHPGHLITGHLIPAPDPAGAVQEPSPPLAVQARGSQADSPSSGELGAAKAPLPPVEPLVVPLAVVAAVGGAVVVVVAVDPAFPFPFALAFGLAAVVVVVGAGALAFTEKSVPVVTVTWAPSVVGPLAMMTAPESDRATSSAAASSAGVFWA